MGVLLLSCYAKTLFTLCHVPVWPQAHERLNNTCIYKKHILYKSQIYIDQKKTSDVLHVLIQFSARRLIVSSRPWHVTSTQLEARLNTGHHRRLALEVNRDIPPPPRWWRMLISIGVTTSAVQHCPETRYTELDISCTEEICIFCMS